jgi:hypothetical protein
VPAARLARTGARVYIAIEALETGAAMAAIIYEGQVHEVVGAESGPDALWLKSEDLERVSGWEIKPEGICRAEACIPVPEDQKGTLLRGEEPSLELNLAAFAAYLGLPQARDRSGAVWSFGAAPLSLRSNLAGLQAPDFTLPDVEGHPRSLSDFRGRKVFMLLWSSW